MNRCLSLAVAILLATPSLAKTQQFAEVTINASDYAYINPPPSVKAGLTAFALVNKGAMLHEMVCYGRNPASAPTPSRERGPLERRHRRRSSRRTGY